MGAFERGWVTRMEKLLRICSLMDFGLFEFRAGCFEVGGFSGSETLNPKFGEGSNWEDGILQLLHRKLEPYPPILKLEKPRNGGPNHSEPPTPKRVTAISPEP